MATPNNYWYDPFTNRTLSRDEYIYEMQRQQANAMQSLSNMQRQDQATKPIPQPEPFLNPVLLLLE